MLLAHLRDSVLQTALEMERLGLTKGTSGNVSARDAESGLIAITPSGVPYASLTPADVPVIDLDGQLKYGHRKPSSETPMHCAVYRAACGARGGCGATATHEVGAIVHTHSPYATALSVMNRHLPPITVPLAQIGEVPVLPFQMPGSSELAAAVASRIGTGSVCCLLQNHGVVCVGPNLARALESAVYVEEGAQVAVYVLSAGGDLKAIPADLAERVRAEARRGGSV